MWRYQEITRVNFEKRKDFVEHIFIELGACLADLKQLHFHTIVSNRPVFVYNGKYYRVDEVLFPKKPFIVIECADCLEDVINNVMEDADPFPYDLSDREIVDEIQLLLGFTHTNS